MANGTARGASYCRLAFELQDGFFLCSHRERRNVNPVQRNCVGGMGVGCDDLMMFCIIVWKVKALLWPSGLAVHS